jgi:methylase of polypeptide subunit release factors
VPNNFKINPAAMMEPRIAIFGGQDGLDVYRKLFSQISQASTMPDYVLTESLPLQHDLLADIASRSGYGLTKRNDFIQLFTKLKN